MGWFSLFVLSSLLWSLFSIMGTYQLQSSQTQVLSQLRKQLEYPKPLEVWSNGNSDLCYMSPSPQVNITCENNSVTELEVSGDMHERARSFNGVAMEGFTLSGNFSMDSLVATLSRLTSLRVLSLVSLGIWGSVPDKIHRLVSLEHLDLSWNYLYGSVPPTLSRLLKLQSLNLDGNHFNGSFPDWFDSLSNLSSLSLKSNELSGKLPSSVKGITALAYIGLSSNGISGEVPDFSSLSRLSVVDLSSNRFGSGLPALPGGIVMAFLGNNSFSGEIPKSYTQLRQVQQLDLSMNSLEGTPPGGLFSLPSLTYLNLSANRLSGSFPARFTCGSELGQVDISGNRLRGQLPWCLSSPPKNRVVKFGGNCLAGVRSQNPETDCMEDEVEEKELVESKGKNVGVLVGVIAGIIVVLVLVGFGFLALCRVYCPRGSSEQHLLRKQVQENAVTRFPSELLMNARFMSEAMKVGKQDSPAHRLFSFDELKQSTNNFDKRNFMGEGSTGKIYKGQLDNGVRVAIRCLTVSKKFTMRNFRLRLDLLAKLRHPHLVCFLGHCIDGEGKDHRGVCQVYLVYEYVANGSYRAHLSETHPEKVLKWSDRLSILLSIAKAVHFLHTGVIPGFFSNRLKANNILLNEQRVAKLSDYGLSIIQEDIDKREVTGEAFTTWQTKSLEDDIYSFGIILLESFAGASVSARTDTFLIDEMASFESQGNENQSLDPAVLSSCSRESLSIVVSITRKCISLESASRPSFEDILWNLQYAAQVQANADGDLRY